MNRNLRMTILVLALGFAYTGFSTPGLAAAAPAQQDQEHGWNGNGDHHDNRNGDEGYFEQGLRDGQHDRQYGGNRSDHQQPRDSNDLRAYQDGYRQGFRSNPRSWFQQGLRDGQHDRRYGGNRSDHQQPGNRNDLSAYQTGYREGFRNNR
jgi:hypothetical protein